MKDMSIIANKKIINKETNEVRLVVSIDIVWLKLEC